MLSTGGAGAAVRLSRLRCRGSGRRVEYPHLVRLRGHPGR